MKGIHYCTTTPLKDQSFFVICREASQQGGQRVEPLRGGGRGPDLAGFFPSIFPVRMSCFQFQSLRIWQSVINIWKRGVNCGRQMRD